LSLTRKAGKKCRFAKVSKRERIKMKIELKKHFISEKMVFIGFGLAAIYWILESFLYIFSPSQVGFFEWLFGGNVGGIWTRLIVLCLFVFFGSHAQYTLDRRKRAEEALQKSEEKYRRIIESIEDGYYEVDLTGNLTFLNDPMLIILGRSRDECMGMDLFDSMDEENAGKVFKIFNNVQRTGIAVNTLDCVLTAQDGSKRHVEASVSLKKNSKGESIGFMGILRNVTERKKAEELQQAKLTAEAASRSKSEFLANMSHEIRTPLNSIIGFVEMILETDLTPEQRESLDIVMSSSYALLSVINDILDFSKIEAGKLELEETPFNLRDFLADSLKIIAAKAHQKGLDLIYRVAPDGPDGLIGDPARLRQVVLNLVGNATKFTDKGEILLSVHVEHQTDNEVLLHFAVKDTGIGIPKEKQESIFFVFQQVDGSTSRRFGGTGLGLAISRQLVKLMGGRIWLESEAGQGSTFHFTARFTLSPDAEDVFKATLDDRTHGVKVLVVDDNATYRHIIQETLKSWNMLPLVTSETGEARKMLIQAQETGSPFDLILIDSSMSDPDGLSLARWIKTQENINVKVIMMLTVLRRSQIDFQELGIQSTITKPVRSSDLLDAIQIALDGLKSLPEPEVSLKVQDRISEPVGRPLRILVAEDNLFNQKFIFRLLERWKHQVVIVANGRLAVEALSQDKFDLVLMDVQMPEMDGFEATVEIREREKRTGNHIPIIAMTAHAMKGDREHCIEAGMDAHVPKPVSATHLLEMIQKLFPAEPGDPF